MTNFRTAKYDTEGLGIDDPNENVSFGLEEYIDARIIQPYTWATKPVAAGNTGLTIRVTDVGTSLAGSLFISDGTNWRPVGGSIVLHCKAGSAAAPLFTSAFGGSTIMNPVSDIVIPAGIIIPEQSQLEVNAVFRRTAGGTTGATAALRVGTNNAASGNAQPMISGMGTSANGVMNPNPIISFPTANLLVSTNWLATGSVSVGGSLLESSGNINTASDMFVNFLTQDMQSGDAFQLLSYRVVLYV